MDAEVDYNQLTDSELINRFTDCYNCVASSYKEMASILQVLDERGVDTSSLDSTLVDDLRCINRGELSPELLAECPFKRTLLKVAGKLDLSIQDRIAQGEKFPIATLRGNEIHWSKIDVRRAKSDQLELLFKGNHVRSQEEQESLLSDNLPQVVHSITPNTKLTFSLTRVEKAKAKSRAEVKGLTLEQFTYESAKLGGLF